MAEASGPSHGSDRRAGDRRTEQAPFAGGDKRSGERRSGTDRRDRPRTRLTT